MSVISYIIIGIIVVQFINRIKRSLQQSAPAQPQRHRPTQQPLQQQQAADIRMASEESTGEDREGRTEEYRDYAEDWITPVMPTLHDEIRPVTETEREIVHETVHETVRVRQLRHEAPAPSPAQEPHPLRLDKQALAQALLLNEVLGEPRAKRPWRPHRSK